MFASWSATAKGLPDSVTTTWPLATVQACVIHLLRNTFRYASRKDWDALSKDLRPIYTSSTEASALTRFDEFAEKWDARYPAVVKLWRSAWTEFVPFLDYDVEIRRIICTTNSIVIWSWFLGVFDVHDGAVRSRDLRAGRGYLPLSNTRVCGRFHVCSAGGDAVVAA